MSSRGIGRPARGFTLIELLVALFITAIMFAIGYTELSQALTSRRELEQQSARLLEVQHAVRTLQQDFELLQPRPVRNVVGDGFQPALVASEALGYGSTGGSSAGPNGTPAPLVTFTRCSWTNPVGIERSELQRVSYALQNGTLIREYSPVLDATLEDKVVTRTLLTHVKRFSLRFMDAGHNWQTQWPAPGLPTAPQAQASQLRTRPVAVEITLQLDDWGLIVRDVEVAG